MAKKNKNDEILKRQKKATEIIKNAKLYKICEGCNSIVAKEVTICPNCHSYRYEENPQKVKAQALELGKRSQSSVLSSDLE